MDERPVERETVVVASGDRGGGGGTIAAILVVLVIAVLAFLYFGGYLQRAADETNINVGIEAPNIELPDVRVETPPVVQQQQPAQQPQPADANKQ
jgi:hypothetical protein